MPHREVRWARTAAEKPPHMCTLSPAVRGGHAGTPARPRPPAYLLRDPGFPCGPGRGQRPPQTQPWKRTGSGGLGNWVSEPPSQCLCQCPAPQAASCPGSEPLELAVTRDSPRASRPRAASVLWGHRNELVPWWGLRAALRPPKGTTTEPAVECRPHPRTTEALPRGRHQAAWAAKRGRRLRLPGCAQAESRSGHGNGRGSAESGRRASWCPLSCQCRQAGGEASCEPGQGWAWSHHVPVPIPTPVSPWGQQQ